MVYRLPTEAEWAWAARSNGNKPELKFPWGTQLPPGKNSGNYADVTASRFLVKTIKDYNDGFAVTAPVGSFHSQSQGLVRYGWQCGRMD